MCAPSALPLAQRTFPLQVWAPLSFNADGSINQLRWIDNFTLPIV